MFGIKSTRPVKLAPINVAEVKESIVESYSQVMKEVSYYEKKVTE